MKKLILYFLLASAGTSLRAVEKSNENNEKPILIVENIKNQFNKYGEWDNLTREDRIAAMEIILAKCYSDSKHLTGLPDKLGSILFRTGKNRTDKNTMKEMLNCLEKYKLSENQLHVIKKNFFLQFITMIYYKKNNDLIQWLSYPYGPMLRPVIKKLLIEIIEQANNKTAHFINFDLNDKTYNFEKPLSIIQLSKIAFFSDSEIDFEEGDLDYIFKYITKDIKKKSITKAIKKKYFIPSEILDILWTKLTLNKNRRDLENNPMAREIAEKATEISDIMMKNFLEDKENAPSRELLKGVLAHTLKEPYPMEILKYRAKAQGIPSSASKFLKLPPCLLAEIENYNGLNTLGKAANRELLLQIGEKIYPATITPEVLSQESHGTKQASHNTRRSHLDSLEERKE